MKIVTDTPDRLVIEARHGFWLFVALIFGLLFIKSGLSSVAANPGVLTGLWLAVTITLSLTALWALSERLTVTLDTEKLRVETRRLGAAREETWPIEQLTGAQASSGSGKKSVLELTLRDSNGAESVLRPGSAPRPPGASAAADAINAWRARRLPEDREPAQRLT